MNQDRRDFIKKAGFGVTGLGSLGLGTLAGAHASAAHASEQPSMQPAGAQQFNMCNYAAPRLETVRVGFIGVGNRGMAAVERLNKIAGVEIKAVCDLRESKVNEAVQLTAANGHRPQTYHTDPNAWKKLCARPDIDLVYIVTPWALHTPMAVFAMKHGKHVCVEVPAAKTIDECWELVETSEKTRRHCMMTENCCYDFHELLTLNLTRQDFFGEITHAEGAYIHDLQEYVFDKERFYQMWEFKELSQRTGNLYPTHGLGPICQVMNINRGDAMDYLVSMSNNDFVMGDTARRLAASDADFRPFAGRPFNGMMNTSTIRTKKGKTIMLQFDVASPRPYSRIQLISGTKGAALKYPEPPRIAKGHEWLSAEEYKALEMQHTPPIVRKIGEAARQVGGHGGMDFLMDWRTIDCLRNGLPLDQDVYDAALWSAIGPLSEWSVAHRSNSIDVPDFTRGAWKTNTPIDISMAKGGNTGVRL